MAIQWTLFRQNIDPKLMTQPTSWTSNQIWMAHSAFSIEGVHHYEERFARGGIGQSSVELIDGKLNLWLNDWKWQGNTTDLFPSTLTFTVNEHRFNLSLEKGMPWILHGDNGYSEKSDSGNASYYVSMPTVEVKGTYRFNNQMLAIEGMGWLDHEWSTQPLREDQTGWDWFSLHFDSGYKLMVFQVRQLDKNNSLRATWVRPNGSTQTFKNSQIILQPLKHSQTNSNVASVKVPTQWQLTLPELNKEWIVSAEHANHWLDTVFPYWEGPVTIKGDDTGFGFLEMTGYQ